MAIQRMDNVGIVVDDLEATIAFFVELGMELEGEAQIEGLVADRCVGLDGVRCDVRDDADSRRPRPPRTGEVPQPHCQRANAAEPAAQHTRDAPGHVLTTRLGELGIGGRRRICAALDALANC